MSIYIYGVYTRVVQRQLWLWAELTQSHICNEYDYNNNININIFLSILDKATEDRYAYIYLYIVEKYFCFYSALSRVRFGHISAASYPMYVLYCMYV